MTDVLGLGEVLIDFTPIKGEAGTNPLYEANPGGAPANVLVSLAKLGRNTSLISAVGNDAFGDQLITTLEGLNVSTKNVIRTNIHTTLAFVHIAHDGDRSFSFCRNPGADLQVRKQDISLPEINKTKIFHIGSLSLTDEPIKSSTHYAVNYAKENNILISMDVNLRESLWTDLQTAKSEIEGILPFVDILKVSEEELAFLTDCQEIEDGIQKLREEYNFSMIFVTAGSIGSYLFHNGKLVFKEAEKVHAIDTTGCGDAFFAGVLHKILELKDMENLDRETLETILTFGNKMGAFVATKRGAIPAMPTIEELEL